MKHLSKVGDTIDRGISILVYGDPGVGKTTLASTLPAGETVIINTEAGMGPLLGTGHIVFNLNGVDDLVATTESFYKYLRTEKHPFKYVVLDNISEFEQQLVLYYTRKRGKETPELREHGDTSFKMKEYLHLFRDLVYSGITVVFNAWEFPLDIVNDGGRVITKTFPKVGKKIASTICGIVDVVGHLEVHEKSNKRWLRIGPSDQFITKTLFQGLDAGEMPDLPTILEKLYAYSYKKEEVKDVGKQK